MDMIQKRRRPRKSFVTDKLLGVDATVGFAKGDMPLPGDLTECGVDGHRLQIASEILLALESFEQRLEVPRAKALCALSLDDLVEQRRTIFHWLGKDLQQI